MPRCDIPNGDIDDTHAKAGLAVAMPADSILVVVGDGFSSSSQYMSTTRAAIDHTSGAQAG